MVARRLTRTVRVDAISPDPAAIAEAAQRLRHGQLVVFPTETVYGLGAHALDVEAVAAIFGAKERPETDPLIVHVGSRADLDPLAADVPTSVRDLTSRFWPGPLTVLVRKRPEVPDLVTAGHPTVAVRVPQHPVALAVLRAAAVPVAAPSANRFSRPSPTAVAHVLADLDGRVDFVLDAGPTAIGVESTIVDGTTDPPVVRRAGGLPIELLRLVVPGITAADAVEAASTPQRAPGQLLRHYAPVAPMTVYDGPAHALHRRLALEVRMRVGAGARVGVLAPDEMLVALAPAVAASAAAGRVIAASLGAYDQPHDAARVLFARLRELDAAGVSAIVACAPVGEQVGAAVRDRLRRAAEGRVVMVVGDDVRSAE